MKLKATKNEVVAVLENQMELTTGNGKWWSDDNYTQLQHGQHSRPAYQPRRYKGGWGVYCDPGYYRGTLNVAKPGKCEELYDTNGNLID